MSAQSIKILLVDDEARFRSASKKLLQRRGYEVITAGDGEEAISMALQEPDVVILDINMPGKDGLQVLADLKERHPKLPVIMLTGHGSQDKAKEAVAAGAQDFLTKPCDMDLLVAKISEVSHRQYEKMDFYEGLVRDVMIPLEDYTSLHESATVKQAIASLHDSFSRKGDTPSIMETGHRSVLITGDDGRIVGILSILELLDGLMPAYLSYPKPSTADAIQYSPIFWRGLFSREMKKLAGKQIAELMSPTPHRIDASASLLEAAFILVEYYERRLLVTEGDQPVGVLREQDLFFEMERILFR